MGAKALKEIHDENGLSVEKVEDVMYDVQDIIDEHDEIQNIVGAVKIATEVDELELEQELQDLMNDDRNDNDTGLDNPTIRHNPDDSLERRLNDLKLPYLDNLALQENEKLQVHVRSN